MTLTRKLWISREREDYFLRGLIVTCVIGGFVSTYWYSSDRMAVKANIKLHLRKISKTQESQKLKESQFYAPQFHVGTTQYYKLEEENALPKIPDLPERKDEN